MANPNDDNLWYNPNLRHFAHANRSDMTKAEACLWKYVLSARRMKGYQFRRQRPVLNYIADFMCKDLMLVIEVDGITHQWEEVIKNDRLRQSALEAAGFSVLRFDDEDVLADINGVYYLIEKFIGKIEIRRKFDDNSVHPQPPPAGDMHSDD